MNTTIILAVFVLVASVVVLLGMILGRQDSRIANRVSGLAAGQGTGSPQDLMARWTTQVVPRMAIPLLSQDEAEQKQLTRRLIHAGFYQPSAMSIFLGAKMLLAVIPIVLGAVSGALGLAPFSLSVLFGCLLAVAGLVVPSFWLDHCKSVRQTSIRRALSDALDMIVICMDGGMSLSAALQRVDKELRIAHPLLAQELALVQRAGELGQPLPEALRQCAARFDLEELSLLARIVAEAERFGTSVAKSLRVHAETLRVQRRQRAEETAQRAAIWILFPTMLFILPVTFFVVLAPAIIRSLDVFRAFNL